MSFVGTNYAKGETPDKDTKITNYTIVDTSEDLLVDPDTVVVSIYELDEDNNVTLIDITDTADVTYEDGTLTVSIPWVDEDGNHLYKNEKEVGIQYDAEVLAVDEATNDVTFNWNETHKFDDDTSTVENFSFDLVKDNADKEVLTGAEFTLYKTADGTEAIEFVVDEDGNYVVANSLDENTVTTIEAGTATIKGLGDGAYYLQEDKAPDGYNKLVNRVEVTINGEDETATLDNGKYTDGGVEVVNETGTVLPSTGGMGTTIFYVVGGILVVGACVLLVSKKRMAAK